MDALEIWAGKNERRYSFAVRAWVEFSGRYGGADWEWCVCENDVEVDGGTSDTYEAAVEDAHASAMVTCMARKS